MIKSLFMKFKFISLFVLAAALLAGCDVNGLGSEEKARDDQMSNNTLSEKGAKSGKWVAIQSAKDNTYMCADISVNHYGLLFCNRTEIGDWEKFFMIDLGNGYVAFQSYITAKYVTAEKNGTRRLTADGDSIGTEQTFYLDKFNYYKINHFHLYYPGNRNYVHFATCVPEQADTGSGVGYFLVILNP
jgi:hypothetical protein